MTKHFCDKCTTEIDDGVEKFTIETTLGNIYIEFIPTNITHIYCEKCIKEAMINKLKKIN